MHSDPFDSDDPMSLIDAGVVGEHELETEATFVRNVIATRRAKDEFFTHSQRSPVPHDLRRTFAGLAYFPPDPSYRIAGLRLEPVGDGDRLPFAIDTSDNRPRMAYRLGRLRFVLARLDLSLTAYRVGDSESATLFVPFTDETSGRETYGAGRYLDIEPEADGSYVLDFNDAYFPYCAYSNSYSCPLPPAENRLPLRVEAGERQVGTPPPGRSADPGDGRR